MQSYVMHLFAILLITLQLLQSIQSAPLAEISSRQFVPPLPGYIPVYIRHGDEPLEDINPQLAAAFRAYAVKQSRLTGRALNDLLDVGDRSSVSSGEDAKAAAAMDSAHIQKIKPKS